MGGSDLARAIEEQALPPEQLWLLTDPSPEATQQWIETFLTIETPQATVVKFKLFPQQVDMLKQQTGRDLTIKGRQTRASSLILAKNLRRMVTNPGLKCLTMTQDDQTTATFRSRIKHHLKDLEQHGMSYPMELDNENELIFKHNGSRYVFASGNQQVAGRAYTGHIVHLSEFAHWPHATATKLFGAIQASVPGPPYGWFDVESTPNGAEGQFYDEIITSDAYDPDSRWHTRFFPWSHETRYRVGTTRGCDILVSEEQYERELRRFQPTPDEEKVMGLLNLDVGQVLWRRTRKKEQDKTDQPFLQEYPETLEGCFITASGNYFASPDGVNHLEQYRDMVRNPIETKEELPYKGGTVSFGGPNLMIWQTPQNGAQYVAWVDCAGGGLGEQDDFSAIVVMNAVTRMVVARLMVRIAPQEFAPMAAAVALYYNTALLGGERDAFGSTCLTAIQNLYYPNLWYYIDPAKPMRTDQIIENAWAHPTQIRNEQLTSLRAVVIDHSFTCFDGAGVQQMGSFTWMKVAQKREGLKAAGKRGQKDDLVICMAGCTFIAHEAASLYNGKQEAERNKVTIVGPHGLVIPPGNQPAPSPWLR